MISNYIKVITWLILLSGCSLSPNDNDNDKVLSSCLVGGAAGLLVSEVLGLDKPKELGSLGCLSGSVIAISRRPSSYESSSQALSEEKKRNQDLIKAFRQHLVGDIQHDLRDMKKAHDEINRDLIQSRKNYENYNSDLKLSEKDSWLSDIVTIELMFSKIFPHNYQY